MKVIRRKVLFASLASESGHDSFRWISPLNRNQTVPFAILKYRLQLGSIFTNKDSHIALVTVYCPPYAVVIIQFQQHVPEGSLIKRKVGHYIRVSIARKLHCPQGAKIILQVDIEPVYQLSECASLETECVLRRLRIPGAILHEIHKGISLQILPRRMEGKRIFHVYPGSASLTGRLGYTKLVLLAVEKNIPIRVKLHHLVKFNSCGYGAFAHIRIVNLIYSDVPYLNIILIIKCYHIGRNVRGSLT